MSDDEMACVEFEEMIRSMEGVYWVSKSNTSSERTHIIKSNKSLPDIFWEALDESKYCVKSYDTEGFFRTKHKIKLKMSSMAGD